MKHIILSLLLSAIITTAAYAEDMVLQFGWDYDESAMAWIDGFRLYQDGVELATIAPNLRIVETPQIKDMNPHTYHLTAFKGDIESGPSDFANVPSYYQNVPPVQKGRFTYIIIPAAPKE